MAITYLLAPIPKWVIMNQQGEAAGGAKLYTYRSLNKVQQKAVYQDPAGTIPWTNPIIFDANGTEGPFYWETDSADLDETYYLEAYDSDDNLLWTIDDYFPPGGGGGGNTTTYVPLNNLIANNVFFTHFDAPLTPVTTNLVVAPSNKQGFTPDIVPVVGTNGVVGPDIRFVKNNTAATDTISFPTFALGSDPLIGDVTPIEYFRYQCTNSPIGETYKALQFPISAKVNNLDNQEMTFQIWAKVAVSAVNLTLYVRQYFGTGGSPTAEARTSVGTISLDTTWTHYNIQFTVPNTSGSTLGDCGDDALYLQLEFPLGAPCDVWLTKPTLYLGNIDPDKDFDTYDQINSIILQPSVGDTKIFSSTRAPAGWVPMNDGSIGNTGSGATTRANQDTFFLYKTLWDSIINTWAPVSTGRGATAQADFVAGKTLTLPRQLGRLMGGFGTGSGLTARVLGEFLGTETISIADMPAHTHPPLSGTAFRVRVPGTGGIDATAGTLNTDDATTGSTGGSAASGKMPPSSFHNVYIKL